MAVTTRTSARPRWRLISHRKPHTVVAAKAIADPYNDTTITHLRSTVGVRQCAEHEMHGS
jgi:hypothetical protein